MGAHLFGGFDVEHALSAFDGDVEGEQPIDAGGGNDVAEEVAIAMLEQVGVVYFPPVRRKKSEPNGAGDEETVCRRFLCFFSLFFFPGADTKDTAEPAYSYNVYSRFSAIVELNFVPFAFISSLFNPCYSRLFL